MSLEPGSSLGPYESLAKIGEGGMGQVFQARDTTLGREVALKVLPEAFTGDPDRLARFEREARVLASLNHPNITAIHGVEQSGDVRAVVLELVEGPILADRIEQGPMPLDEARDVAVQIAKALESAHTAGVVHRDLKPANMKLRRDGTVKVLDFGLAKAFEPGSSAADRSALPTVSLTAAAIQMGMVIGTAAYMAPEQASGKPVDKRSDVWALGVVLVELLTGQRSFAGDDVVKTLAHVIAMEPDLSRLPGDVPPGLAVVVRRCLEKEPAQRMHEVADLRLALKGAFEPELEDSSATLAEPRRPRRSLALAASLVAEVASGLFVWDVTRPELEPPTPSVRFTIDPAEELLLLWGDSEVARSRDGATVVFQTGAFPTSYLAVRALDELEAVPIRGTDRAVQPVVSPDGRFVAFSADGAIYRVPLEGGTRTTVAEGPFRFVGGLSWGAGDQLFFGRSDDGLFRVDAAGGQPERVTTPEPSNTNEHHIFPSVIPGREALVFVVATTTASGTSGRLATVDLASWVVSEAGLEGFHPRYLASGHLVYVGRDGVLRGVSFDANTLEVTGSPVSLLSDVSVKQTGMVNFDVSTTGDLVYMEDRRVGTERRLVWVDREGQVAPTEVSSAAYLGVSIAADGTRVAVEIAEGEGSDVWVGDVERGTLTSVTSSPANEGSPLWHPDGQRITFASEAGVFIQPVDASADAVPVVQLPGLPFMPSRTPSRPMGTHSSCKDTSPTLCATSASSHSTRQVSASRCCRRAPKSGRRRSLPTGGGWPTRRTTQAETRSTWCAIPSSTGACRCRRAEDIDRSGLRMETRSPIRWRRPAVCPRASDVYWWS